MTDVRVYPASCTSANCGETTCPADCPCLPTLLDFKAWVVRTHAVVSDPTWCPTVYTAGRAALCDECGGCPLPSVPHVVAPEGVFCTPGCFVRAVARQAIAEALASEAGRRLVGVTP